MIALGIILWFVVGFGFSIALIHHTKAVFGKEAYNYLKSIGAENLFSSQKYSMHTQDFILSLWLSILGPIIIILFLIKCLADAIVWAISILTK